MAGFAAVVLFGWGLFAAGYGFYAAQTALESENSVYAVQAGIAFCIATVSFGLGFVVVMLGKLQAAVICNDAEAKTPPPEAEAREP